MLKQIKYFLAVVDCNSFTEAAEQCFISQSAISQQISALEEDLGVQLIKREKRRFSLTAAGEYLYQNGAALLEKAEELRRETIRIGQDDELQLRIGYLIGYEGKELQDTIYEFTEDYPEVILSMAKYSHEDLFKRISNNEIDLVLSYQRRAFSEAYENFHLRYIPCLVEIPGRSKLALEESVSTEQLKDMPCILVAKKEQQELEQGFYQNVLGIGSSFYFVESIDDARLAVIGNRGFLPIADVGNLPDTGKSIRRLPIHRPDNKPIQLNYCAFWKKDRSNYYIEEFASMFYKRFNQES